MAIFNGGNDPTLKWRLGRIIKIYPGQDNVIQVAKVKTAFAV